jgi:hypothetical protein
MDRFKMKNVSIVVVCSVLLASCGSDDHTAKTQSSEMIESPIQSTIIESFDHYPPEPAAPKIAARAEETRESSAEVDLTGAIGGDQPSSVDVPGN